MEKIEKILDEFKSLNNKEKVTFMKEAMPFMTEILRNNPQKIMTEMMPACMKAMKSKSMNMDMMQEMMKGMMG